MTKKHFTCLIIDQVEEEYHEIRRALMESELWDIQFIYCKSHEEGYDIIKAGEADFCFLEYYLKSGRGDQFLQQLAALDINLPVILITEQKDLELEEKCFQIGAADYLVKSELDQETLERAVKHCIARNEQMNRVELERQKYRNLFHNSLDAIFTADANFQIIEANDSFKKLLDTEEVKGRGIKELFAEDSPEGLFTEAVKSGGKSTKRTRIKDSAGNELLVYASLSPIFNADQQKYYHGIIHDITELEQAQEKVIEKDKLNLIGRMARIMGHEVRNPLTNILLALEELQDEVEDENEDAVVMLDLIRRNAERISSLIDNFLNSARPVTSELKLQPIEEVIKEAINHCADRLQLLNIDLKTSGLDENNRCQIDRERFQIALSNIVLNAIEAMSESDDPQLEVSVKRLNGNIAIEITDNGSGMDQETKENLFTPFYSNKQGGLGLGMTNVKNILNEHDAKIEVVSEPDQGTTFTILIPHCE